MGGLKRGQFLEVNNRVSFLILEIPRIQCTRIFEVISILIRERSREAENDRTFRFGSCSVRVCESFSLISMKFWKFPRKFQFLAFSCSNWHLSGNYDKNPTRISSTQLKNCKILTRETTGTFSKPNSILNRVLSRNPEDDRTLISISGFWISNLKICDFLVAFSSTKLQESKQTFKISNKNSFFLSHSPNSF